MPNVKTLRYVRSSGNTVGLSELQAGETIPFSDIEPHTHTPASIGAIATTEKGAANGVATLDASQKVPAAQLPSYVDDVLEYANLASFPVTGETGKIYVALDTNKTYRWSGSVYIYITSGAVDSVAGKTGVVTLDKSDVGLSNVDNTSDLNKPISTATQTALNAKQDTLVSATNIKTINGNTLLGSGDLVINGTTNLSYTAATRVITSDTGTDATLPLVTSTDAGLAPASGGGTTNFLRADGTWTVPPSGSSNIVINNKTGAYTVVEGDLGKVINCTSGTFTVSLTAAATLGNGFNCWIWNTSTTGTHVITIDPNVSETVDGLSTITLRRGEGVRIVCDGTNWQTGDKKVMRGYSENFAPTDPRPFAVGTRSVAIGRNASTTNDGGLALGYNTLADSVASTAIGANSSSSGSQAVTGSGAMALGGSYASGTDSFAAAIANNTSSYGASAANTVALGQLAKATGARGVAIGFGPISSGVGAISIGGASVVSPTAIGNYSVALGAGAVAAQDGKYAFAPLVFSSAGDAQTGTMVLRTSTTNATPTVVTSDAAAPSATNQVILPNDSTYAFKILVVARRTDADNESAGYEFKGVVDRNGSAATTAIVGSVTKTVLAEDTAAWDCNVTADTTNGGISITVTGEAAKTIRWVATCWTSEVTG